MRRIPLLSQSFGKLYIRLARRKFASSQDYWIRRYERGGNSGAGSYGIAAQFKADFMNDFVRKQQVRSVIEFGCGDGNQLSLAEYPRYLGFDISHAALSQCRALFRHDDTKTFRHMEEYAGERAQLTLSLDVIYHLVEDDIFDQYMRRLFDSSDQYVIIYSSNVAEQSEIQLPHVRHRRFSDWVETNRTAWKQIAYVPNALRPTANNDTLSDFFVYEREVPVIPYIPVGR